MVSEEFRIGRNIAASALNGIELDQRTYPSKVE
jgi:hypothetical protein